MLSRLHLFEFTDQRWCPRAIRQLVTDYLGAILMVTRTHDPVAPMLAEALRDLGTHRIVDLCSGSGGSLFSLKEQIQRRLGGEIEVVMTDLFPNVDIVARLDATGRDGLRYLAEPVDARAVPLRLTGLRTMFESLHHFRPHHVRQVLQDAVNRRTGIASIEVTARSLHSALLVLASPLVILFLTPWIRPFRWWRLLLTYAVPVASFVVLWDGLVSCLRTYTREELYELISELDDGGSYDWVFEQRLVRGAPLSCLIGLPKNHDDTSGSRDEAVARL
ncbi:MAG: class I SAM-dependent methyltransferase [Proteobacteria bacterium]|nr:class I SAM-dependent methyltransferase [Pseudomonadota bacterium]